jgi:hypothetical protein
MKKYFVKLCDHCDLKDPLYNVTREVTHAEYIMLANTELIGDAATIERILETATRYNGACGVKHLFWTEDYKFPEFLVVSYDAETGVEARLQSDALPKAVEMAETLTKLSKDHGIGDWSAVPGFTVAIYKLDKVLE